MLTEPTDPRKKTDIQKRILFITDTGGYGGTEFHLIRLIGSFDPSAIQARIVCFGEDPYTQRFESIRQFRPQIDRVSRPRISGGTGHSSEDFVHTLWCSFVGGMEHFLWWPILRPVRPWPDGCAATLWRLARAQQSPARPRLTV